MEIFKIIILGIIQGISEILPISSSGHLILIKHLLEIKEEGLILEIFLHLGSLFAVIIYYFKDIKILLSNSVIYLYNKDKNKKQSFNIIIFLFISTLITGLFGIFLGPFIENHLSNITYLPIFFLITSIILYFCKFNNSHKTLFNMTYIDSMIIGLTQVIGLFPGISRSGSTLLGGKLSKLDSKSTFKYSYLLFIPITLSSFLLELIKLINNHYSLNFPIYYYLIGILFSFIFTLLSMKLLKRIINKDKLYYFSYYLLLLALFCIIFIK